jgi:3-hydroxyisobutyrate dehydrogenase
MKVGFIGLGIMGRPMLLKLIKAGYELSVWSWREASLVEARAAASELIGSGKGEQDTLSLSSCWSV